MKRSSELFSKPSRVDLQIIAYTPHFLKQPQNYNDQMNGIDRVETVPELPISNFNAVQTSVLTKK